VGIGRILARLGNSQLVDRLANDLTAADITTLLMTVAAERASRLRAPDALVRYRKDRFSRPGTAPFVQLREVEDAFIRTVPDDWDWITPSPLVPFGTHHVLGNISQDWVVTTIRANEVAADPTVALALESAVRRRGTALRRSAGPERLATIQRVTRAQQYSSEDAFAHFSLFALVTAGRSRPSEGFDPEAILEQLDVYVGALGQMVRQIEIVISASADAPGRHLTNQVRGRWKGHRQVRIRTDDERLAGQRYYSRACFKVNVIMGDAAIEVADGGFTDWTERILDDRRERLLISAAGLDRLALSLHM
jgi:hypothetical protein